MLAAFSVVVAAEVVVAHLWFGEHVLQQVAIRAAAIPAAVGRVVVADCLLSFSADAKNRLRAVEPLRAVALPHANQHVVLLLLVLHRVVHPHANQHVQHQLPHAVLPHLVLLRVVHQRAVHLGRKAAVVCLRSF